MSSRSRDTFAPLLLWTGIVALGVVLIAGRYDWDAGSHFAERGLLLSAYLFAILLPTFFYGTRRLLRSQRAAVVLTALLFVVLTLPWDVLGLRDSWYYADRPSWFTIDQFPPALQFLPGGRLHAFPFDWAFMPLLLAAGAAIVYGIWAIRRRHGGEPSRALPILGVAVLALICAQTFIHSDMRAPYTYLAVFQREAEAQHWYHVFHFDDGSGAGEADQFAFTPIEDIFQGNAREGDNELIRRPFSFYLASQFSFFTNTFYVWLALNVLLWFAAVAAMWRWVGTVLTPRAGLIAAGLTAVGPGFAAFAATPAMYMQAFAAVAIALCAFEELVVRNRGAVHRDVALFTGIAALCALVYDFVPILIGLLVYGLFRGVARRPLIISLAAAGVLSLAFTWVVTGVLGDEIVATNLDQVSASLSRFKDFLIHPDIDRWYTTAVEVVPHFIGKLLSAFFIVPVLLALAGIAVVRDRALIALAVTLLVLSFAMSAVLDIAHLELGNAPRLLYPLFPIVYLYAAAALDLLPRRLGWVGEGEPGGLGKVALAAPWVVLGVMFVLVNADVFGYPSLYIEFFTAEAPKWLPG